MKSKLYKLLGLVFVLLVGVQTSTFASKTELKDTLQINWQPNQTLILKEGGQAKLLYFEDAITRYETASLPWQITELPLNANEMAEHLEIKIITADTIPLSALNEVADLQFITADFQLEIQLLEGKSYATVLPVKQFNGQMIRIKAYTLSYIITEKRQENAEDIPSWKSNSVLATGSWYKIGITETGPYILDYDQLQQMGLNPENFDPENFAVFNNGNGILPEGNYQNRADDLIENAIYVEGGEDGSFDQGDYILFFGQEAIKWKFSPFTNSFIHEQNYYSDTTFYFFTPDLSTAGKRIQQQAQASGTAVDVVNTFLDYQLHEEETENLILSGKEWYGEVLSTTNPVASANFDFPFLNTEKPINVYTKYAGRSITEDMYTRIAINGQIFQDSTKIYKLSSDNPMFAREKLFSTDMTASNDQFEVKLELMASETDSRVWLDYVRVNAWRSLRTIDNKLQFRVLASDTLPRVLKLEIADVTPEVVIWDITDLSDVKAQYFTLSNNTASFNVLATAYREYYSFSPSHAKEPIEIQPIDNQNLHQIEQAEMLVITHPKFIAQANEIAELHQVVDQMDVKVVDVKQIYNEFGGGTADITALRDFIRMVYLRSNQRLKYVLLFGDASYDYKDRIPANTNFVPTYQAAGSTIETQSFVSDDYFGLMGSSEGASMAGILDIGIGRFPVNNVADAQIMVDKVRHYLTKQDELSGQWRNNITFIGDDKDNNLHFDQAETLSRMVDTARANLNVSKIFLDAYPRITVPGGFRYPDANKAFVKQIEEGALIINYTGHGGINGLSDERVFTISDINGLENINNMPFFITATCEFSRFDNPGFVSAGEQLLLTSKGGGIGLMTTTRLAFAHSNFALNKKVYSAMFTRSDASFKRLGDILRLSKNPTSSSVYNFVLLGDPALKLVYPEGKIVTKKVNNLEAGSREIVLHAMSEVQIEGEIQDPNGNPVNDFNGYLYPKLFDKKTKFSTLGNDPKSQQAAFTYYEKLLYSGKVSVVNGKFSFQFQLPRDIAYQYGQAKLSYYAVDTTTFEDASGYFDLFEIGGTNPAITPDTQGPEISLYLNEKTFQNGDIVPPSNVLFARINDPQGIHHLGNSIGRDIVLEFISPKNHAVILNSFFKPETDNFGAGTIQLPLDKLKDGTYQLSLKAWDLHNNSSTAAITFVINSEAGLDLHQVYNYPNPFSTSTAFIFNHNKPQTIFDYELTIYALDGRPLVVLSGETGTNGNRSEPILWNGKDGSGQIIPTGTYVYRLLITDEQGIQRSVNQVMVRLGN